MTFLDRDCASVLFDYLDYNSIIRCLSFLEQLPCFKKWKTTFFGDKTPDPLLFTRSKIRPVREPFFQIDSDIIFETGPLSLCQIFANYNGLDYIIRFMIHPTNDVDNFLKRIYVACFRFHKQHKSFYNKTKQTLVVNVKKIKDDASAQKIFLAAQEGRDCRLNYLYLSLLSPEKTEITHKFTKDAMYYNMRLQVTQCSETKITLRFIQIKLTQDSDWHSLK
jgi:hypothetical protein